MRRVVVAVGGAALLVMACSRTGLAGMAGGGSRDGGPHDGGWRDVGEGDRLDFAVLKQESTPLGWDLVWGLASWTPAELTYEERGRFPSRSYVHVRERPGGAFLEDTGEEPSLTVLDGELREMGTVSLDLLGEAFTGGLCAASEHKAYAWSQDASSALIVDTDAMTVRPGPRISDLDWDYEEPQHEGCAIAGRVAFMGILSWGSAQFNTTVAMLDLESDEWIDADPSLQGVQPFPLSCTSPGHLALYRATNEVLVACGTTVFRLDPEAQQVVGELPLAADLAPNELFHLDPHWVGDAGERVIVLDGAVADSAHLVSVDPASGSTTVLYTGDGLSSLRIAAAPPGAVAYLLDDPYPHDGPALYVADPLDRWVSHLRLGQGAVDSLTYVGLRSAN